ncbi:hypothetical protein [Glaciecola sp. 33A]|jgi:hypothetical protein|uniref:hypothetical protein n=1 Tax=Glaciecola sp. 33A TaxID=2057807 RepID=UPI000C349296|nr:hypothetical protein [Glaciecola sp. 33A]PKI00070.1 hypothetical protein CXF81_18050 [Glaciecola sp. 33A]
MNKEQLDNLNIMIRENFLNPDDYPNAKKNKALIGSVYKNDFEESGKWFSQKDYINVIQKIAKFSKDEEFLVIEDFERTYKSSGKVVRLSETVAESWIQFSAFTERTDILSFFAIGRSQNWVIWANRDYWCILVKKSIDKILKLDNKQELNIASFSEADEEFISFIKNLYS